MKITSSIKSSSTSKFRDNGGRMIDEDPPEKWLFPSEAPASLELENNSDSPANKGISVILHFSPALFLIFVSFLR
ncbi:hypothetical protein JTB14_035401 [Gonioctena quinquepunctata]|nr:hypothetical protein JTB14_035401 [Gonioctena quinquepunctata]